MIETRGIQNVEAMNEQSRRIHKSSQTGDNKIGRMYQSAMGISILSVLLLGCLGLWGCEAHEEPPTVMSDPVDNGQEPLMSSPRSLGFRNSTDPLSGENENIPTIVAFGDSLTAGLGVAPDKSYPAQLAKRLEEKGMQYKVINAGVSGETSAGGVRRIEWILKSQPTVVILELGVNDGLRGLPLQQTYSNLHTIIERLKAEGVSVILAGMRIPVNYGEEYTGEFFEMYKRLAQEFRIPLIPFLLEGVAAQPGLNQGDGVHPTAEGYTIVAQNVWHTLEPILNKM